MTELCAVIIWCDNLTGEEKHFSSWIYTKKNNMMLFFALSYNDVKSLHIPLFQTMPKITMSLFFWPHSWEKIDLHLYPQKITSCQKLTCYLSSVQIQLVMSVLKFVFSLCKNDIVTIGQNKL